MKALGGCSSMNAMIYIRGNRVDYDSWRDQYGATGWGFDDLLPYFVRSESNTRLGAPLHGRTGPLHVEDRSYTHPLSHAFVASAVSARAQAHRRLQRRRAGGCRALPGHLPEGPALLDQRGVPRARAEPPQPHGRAPARWPLGLSSRASGRSGVTFRQGGGTHAVRARREVVLCGGAINSPQLLMLSGIGPAAHLARARHRRRESTSPGVGANLQDHPVAPMLWYTRGIDDLAQLNNLRTYGLWKARGRGPLSSNVGEAGAFFATREGLPAPDLQIHVAPTGFYDNGMHEPTSRMVTAAPTLVSVASRGSIRLRSADPRWHPAIDAGVPRGPDRPRRAARRPASHLGDLHPRRAGALPRPALAAAGAPVRRRPRRAHPDLGADALPPESTCAMGSGEDAVVDAELRVRGVEGLRVADASVMPAVPRGNTNAPTIMVAERAADLIRSAP